MLCGDVPAAPNSSGIHRRELGRHVHHGFAGRRKPPRQVPTEASGVLYGPTTLGEPFRPSFERPQSGAVLREAGTLEELACGFVDRGDGYPDALWGSTPIKTFMSARTSVSV